MVFNLAPLRLYVKHKGFRRAALAHRVAGLCHPSADPTPSRADEVVTQRLRDALALFDILVEAFEREHYPIPPPDPIAAIEHCMESRGLTRKVLEPFIGSRVRVSEVMVRRRPLTLRMIRRLTVGLEIPTDALIQPYRTVDHRAA